MSSYSLVTSRSFTSGLNQQRSFSESDQDSVLDGVMCETCMDIVVLMSRTALGACDHFHVDKTQDHTALDLSVWKNHRIIPPLVLLPASSLPRCRDPPVLFMIGRERINQLMETVL